MQAVHIYREALTDFDELATINVILTNFGELVITNNSFNKQTMLNWSRASQLTT